MTVVSSPGLADGPRLRHTRRGNAQVYAYIGNDPLNLTDPSGLYFGIDDLLFSGGGALLGLGAQAIHDVVAGQLSSKGAYAGAVLGGAVGGEALLYTGPIGAGAAAGFVSNATTQAIEIARGNQAQFSGSALAISTGIRAAAGLIPGVSVPGITAGRNSANAVSALATPLPLAPDDGQSEEASD